MPLCTCLTAKFTFLLIHTMNEDEDTLKAVATPAFNLYNDVISFDLYSDSSRILSMLRQLRTKYQPSSATFSRFPNRRRPPSLKKSHQRAIFASWEQSVPTPELPGIGRRRRNTPPHIGANSRLLTQDLKFEFGAVHVNFDLRFLDRLTPLISTLRTASQPITTTSVSTGVVQDDLQYVYPFE